MKTSTCTAPAADAFKDDRLSRRRSIFIRVHGLRERHATMVPWYKQHLLWTCQRGCCHTATALPITAMSARECQGASKRPLVGVCRGARKESFVPFVWHLYCYDARSLRQAESSNLCSCKYNLSITPVRISPSKGAPQSKGFPETLIA